MRHCSSATSAGSDERSSSRVGFSSALLARAVQLAEPDRDAALGELDDAELAAARHAFVAAAVVENEGLLGLPGAALLGARRDPDLDLAGAARLLG